VRFFVGIRDRDWFDYVSRLDGLDEVNFWQPSGNRQFLRLQPGEPFLFKLHSPDNYIVGGSFFAFSTILPASIVWKAFGDKNGALTEMAMTLTSTVELCALVVAKVRVVCCPFIIWAFDTPRSLR